MRTSIWAFALGERRILTAPPASLIYDQQKIDLQDRGE
jgi:hypothetical protein